MVLFGPTNFHTKGTLPLSFRTYTKYFLVPHLASFLIAEDKDTDMEEGWEIMTRSAEVGDTLQSLTLQEDLLEDIFTANVNRHKSRNVIGDAAVPNYSTKSEEQVSLISSLIGNCYSELTGNLEKAKEESSIPRRLASKGASKVKVTAGKPLTVAEFPIETVSSPFISVPCTVLTYLLEGRPSPSS